MSGKVQATLDYEGKLDRSPENLEMLLAHGEERGRQFIEDRAKVVGSK